METAGRLITPGFTNGRYGSGAAVAVPEPGTFALLGIGGIALLGVIRRRRAS
ncbi:MAG: PEP-CTERM sorting domain-containing protein [Fibrella sp.]|nr:PEP-CTERM sorting domain-containing protein [Armatimonadota bacterium]